MWSLALLVVLMAVLAFMVAVYSVHLPTTSFGSYATDLYTAKKLINDTLKSAAVYNDLNAFLAACNNITVAPPPGKLWPTTARAVVYQVGGRTDAVCAFGSSRYAFYRIAAIVEKCSLATDWRGQRSYVAQVKVYTDPLILTDVGFSQLGHGLPAVGWYFNSTYVYYYVPVNPLLPFYLEDYPIRIELNCPIS
ncbi:MAG: hypothetical protein ACP5I3_12180 [Thermoproteus sp.]